MIRLHRFTGLRPALLAAAGLVILNGAAQAAVVCLRPGLPVGCVAGAAATPVVGPGGPVVNPTPGLGYGAPGAGLRPAAGPGVGPNFGGPANFPGRR
ncbi:MAG: hypothetical protein WD136_00050 [Cyanobium sp.]